MDRGTNRSRLALLREASRGTSTRRSLLRRGVKAGLGFGALAGLLATREARPVQARYEGFGDCLLVKDYDCYDRCVDSYNVCRRTESASTCSSRFSTCNNCCWYSVCMPDEGAGAGVPT